MKYLKSFKESISSNDITMTTKNENRIDWSIWDEYEYKEGDGVYLDDNELRKGRVVTTNTPSPFINMKHPKGEHIMNRNTKDAFNKQRSMIRKYVYDEEPVRCSDCGEYSPDVSTNHLGSITIPLCSNCFNED